MFFLLPIHGCFAQGALKTQRKADEMPLLHPSGSLCLSVSPLCLNVTDWLFLTTFQWKVGYRLFFTKMFVLVLCFLISHFSCRKLTFWIKTLVKIQESSAKFLPSLPDQTRSLMIQHSHNEYFSDILSCLWGQRMMHHKGIPWPLAKVRAQS